MTQSSYRLFAEGRQGDLIAAQHRNVVDNAIDAASDQHQLELLSMRCAIALATHDRTTAGRCFEKAGVFVDGRPLEKFGRTIDELPPHVAALWHLNVARFSAQERHYRFAVMHARNAAKLLPAQFPHLVADPVLDCYRFLLGCEARLLLAQATFIRNDQREALRIAAAASESLLLSYRALREKGMLTDWQYGVDAMLACTHSLRAYFDWVRGRYDQGRRRIYQALHFFQEPVRHHIGKAMALLTASRIEAMAPGIGVEIQLRHLGMAERLYEGKVGDHHPHPHRWLARVQQAQCYAKTGAFAEADNLLRALSEEVGLLAKSGQPREAVEVMGDVSLTRIWLLESRNQWPLVLAEASDLCNREKESLKRQGRMGIEALLHRGIARLHQNEPDLEGIADVEQALNLANETGRERIQIRAHLSLAESLGDRSSARSHYMKASELLAHHPGDFLRRLQQQLARRFRAIAIEVNIDQSLSDAVDQLREQFAQVVLGSGASIDEIRKSMRVSRAQAYRIRSQLRRED